MNDKVMKINELESCQEELKISELNYGDVSETFGKMFTTLHSKLDELVSALNTTIIPEYSVTAESITKMFNNDFATQINEYLNVIKKEQ